MKGFKAIFICLISTVILFSYGCTSAVYDANQTSVTVVVGQTGDQSEGGGIGTVTSAVASIPDDVVQIILEAKRIDPDDGLVIMEQLIVDINGQSGVSVDWTLESGNDRWFTAKALNAEGETTHYGKVKVDLQPDTSTTIVIETKRSIYTKNWVVPDVGNYTIFNSPVTGEKEVIFWGQGEIIDDYSQNYESLRRYSSGSDTAHIWDENEGGWLQLRRYVDLPGGGEGYVSYKTNSVPSVPEPKLAVPAYITLQDPFESSYIEDYSNTAEVINLVTANRSFGLVDFEDVTFNGITFIGVAVIFEETEKVEKNVIYSDTYWFAEGVGIIKINSIEDEITVPSPILSAEEFEVLYAMADGVTYGTPEAGSIVVATNVEGSDYTVKTSHGGELQGTGIFTEFRGQLTDTTYTANFDYTTGYGPPSKKSAYMGEDQGVVIANYYRKPGQAVAFESGVDKKYPVIWENFIVWIEDDGTSEIRYQDGNGDQGLIDSLLPGVIDIFNNRVVYDDSTSNDGIYSFEIGVDSVPQTEASGTLDYYFPSVFGDWLFWTQMAASPELVFSPLDHDTGSVYFLVDDGSSPWVGFASDVWRDRIAFTDESPDYWVTEADYINAPPDTPGTDYKFTTSSEATNLARIYEDKIIWAENRSGNLDIFMNVIPPGTGTTTEVRLTDTAENESSPDIYGEIAVWQVNNGSDEDIYMADLTTDPITVMPLVEGPGDQLVPRIFGNKVVYTDVSGAEANIFSIDLGVPYRAPLAYGLNVIGEPVINSDGLTAYLVGYGGRQMIRTYDMKSGEKRDIYSPTIDIEGMSISNPLIAFYYDNGTDYDVELYNYETDSRIDIGGIGANSDQMWPDVADDIVVWQDNRDDNEEIYLFDNRIVPMPDPVNISEDDADDRHPRTSEGVVVWDSDRGEGGGTHIWSYTVKNRRLEQLTDAEGTQEKPDISGDLVVYLAYGNPPTEAEVRLYDMKTNKDSLICDDPGDKDHLRIDGDLVAWEDLSTGDIWAYDLVSGLKIVVADGSSVESSPEVGGEYVIYNEGNQAGTGTNSVYYFHFIR